MVTRLPPLADILTQLRAAPADEEAWRQLHERLWPFVYGVVYRRLHGARTAAEDAAQEVFLRLARAMPFARMPEEGAFRAYVWKVADNVARTLRARLLREAEATESETLQSEGPSPEAEATARDVLRALVSELDSTEIEMVRLLLEGHGLADIVSKTGLSYGVAGVRLHRLRRKLRKSLSEKGLLLTRPEL